MSKIVSALLFVLVIAPAICAARVPPRGWVTFRPGEPVPAQLFRE